MLEGTLEMRVGVEVGGTFTDLVAIDGASVRIAKVPSTPGRPDDGALAALQAAEIDLARVADLVHGSTVATNAILERKGARIAFLVTRGFRDILFLQRHNRRSIYDLKYAKPVPVVARRDILEIDERIDGKGEVVGALDADATALELRRFLEERDVAAIAICLLNGYRNPTHEALLAEIVAQTAPELAVTCSHEVTREFREYERATTATLSAYVQPVIDGYLKRLSARLDEQAFAGRFSVMQSNGGRLPAAGMGRNAITSLFSGPAAGVMGAVRQAGLSGYHHLISLDMGGTSTDVCLIADGRPDISSETEVDGLPIRTPVLDIVTVGAGGGSICWVDDGGMLRVGPQSAGAEPGPACYGRGGDLPTVTDAHMIRGTIRPEAFLGGRMNVDARFSRTSFEGLAAHFGESLEAMADNAVRLAESNIVRAIQLVSTERGRDARDYVLCPFGGAGPLHVVRVAEELGIRTIVVPPNAGVLSAYGLLAADFVQYETRTHRVEVDDGAAATVCAIVADMEAAARHSFAALEVQGEISFDLMMYIRFIGQAFEVSVEFDFENLKNLDRDEIMERFGEAHHRIFAFGEAGTERAEIISFRLGARIAQADTPHLAVATADKEAEATTRIFDRGEWHQVTLATRARFASGETLRGPLLVEDETSTVYAPPGWCAALDARDNLILTMED